MNPLYNISSKAPFLKYVVAFGSGIIASGMVSVPFCLLIVCLASIFLLRFFPNQLNTSRNIQQAYSFLIAIFLFSSGIFHSDSYQHNLTNTVLPSSNSEFTGLILEKSPAKNERFKYLIGVNAYRDSSEHFIPTRETIVLYNADSLSNANSKPGMIIHFESKLFPISSSNNPGAFNYQRFMLREGIRYQVYLRKGFTITEFEKKTLAILALEVQAWLMDRYREAGIKGDEFAVLSALTLGNKNYLSNELKSSFASSGAMHVLAVSGLHVGIIYIILKLLLKPLYRLKRTLYLNMGIIVAALWAYAFITGLSPSVLRSCTMFSFITIGEHLHRRSNFYNILAASAFFLLIGNPNILYKVGFQLSYAAVASIVFFQPKIAALLHPQNRILKWLWDLTAVSLAAQIGTFPISIHYFQQFPVYFWLSNFVAIPAAGLLLYLAFFFFLTLPIGVPGNIAGTIIGLVVKGLNESVIFIEKLPFSVLTGLSSNGVTLAMMVMVVFSLAWLSSSKRYLSLVFFLSVLLVFSSYSAYLSFKTSRQAYLVFYDSYQSPMFSIIDGKRHLYYIKGDTLSESGRYLLQGASSSFSTGEAQPLTSVNDGTVKMTDRYIFYKNLRLKTIQASDTLDIDQDEIRWNPESAHVYLHEVFNHKAQIIQNGKSKSFYFTNGTSSFKTMNNSALILPLFK